MTWLEKYNKACWYAGEYNCEYRKDIVHDAWVYYFKLTGNDLFEVPVKYPLGYISTVIKRAYFRFRHKERLCSWNNDTTYHYFSADEIQSNFDAPDEILIGKDLYNYLYKKLEANHVRGLNNRPANLNIGEIFRLTSEGFTPKEIGDQLDVKNDSVAWHTRKFKKLKI